MKNNLIILLVTIIIISLLCLQPVSAYIIYEYYTIGGDSPVTLYDPTRIGQSFTVGGSGHDVTGITLKLARVGTPGTLVIEIKATDGNGHPTGGVLTSGSIAYGNITTNLAGAWYNITMTRYTLSANTKYVILLYTTGTSQNYYVWLSDYYDSSYSGGLLEYSNNSGGSWVSYSVYDLMFIIYAVPSTVLVTITSSPTGAGYVVVDGSATSTPHIYTWNIDSTHTIASNSPANLVSGQSQYIYTGWSDSGAQSHIYTVSTVATVTANFQYQYYLTVMNGNSPTGQGWYNSGVNANPSNLWIWSATGNTRTALTNWSLDSSNQNPTRQNTGTFTTPNIAMSTYHTVNFISIIQYHLTLSSTISEIPVNQTGSQTLDNWYDVNTNSTISATTPYTLGDITFNFRHWYWSLGNIIQTNSTDNSFIVTISNYTSVIAYWNIPVSPIMINPEIIKPDNLLGNTFLFITIFILILIILVKGVKR